MHGCLAPALNRRDYSTLKGDTDHCFDELNRRFGEVNRRLGLIEADQKQFYTGTGKLDERLGEIAER